MQRVGRCEVSSLLVKLWRNWTISQCQSFRVLLIKIAVQKMDPIRELIKRKIDQTREKNEQSCLEIQKALIALNEQNGNSIDETAISKVVSKFLIKKHVQNSNLIPIFVFYSARLKITDNLWVTVYMIFPLSFSPHFRHTYRKLPKIVVCMWVHSKRTTVSLRTT